MLRNTHITVVAFCLAMIMHGAADDAKNNLIKKGALQFIDCFDRKEVTVSGTEHFHIPIIISRTSEPDFLQRLTGAGIPIRSQKLLRAAIGFVSGYDRQLCEQLATEIKEILLPMLLPGKLFEFENICMRELRNDALKKMAPSDFERYTALETTAVDFFPMLQSTDVERDFRTSLRGEHSIVFTPVSVCKKYIAAKSCFSTIDERLAAISRLAKESGGPVSELPFLTLNKERYAEFLNQEFGEQAH